MASRYSDQPDGVQSGPTVRSGGQRSDEIAFVDRIVTLTAGALERILRY